MALLTARPLLAQPTPTETPCDEIQPAELAFDVRVEPPVAMVGEAVTVNATITQITGELAGIPTFFLIGDSLFDVEGEENSYPQVTFVRYHLRAASVGVTRLQVRVSYETSSGCRNAPIFSFRFASSGSYLAEVRAADTPTATPTETLTPSATPTMTITPSPTLTSTASVTPTFTATLSPSATPTPSTTPTPTPSPTPRPCVGDCDDDGTVRVEELLTGVAVALAGDEASRCGALDVDGDGRIAISELIAAIGAALHGCPLRPA